MKTRENLSKLFLIDFNFAVYDEDPSLRPPTSASAYADVDAKEVYDYALSLGNNEIFCHAFTINGCATYPSRLGPVSAGKMGNLFPEMYKLCRDNGVPIWSYFSVAQDGHMSHTHPHWLVPGTDFLAPETPWTDFLCARMEEFLSLYPVDWLNIDAFTYGSFFPDTFEVKPAWFVKEPFLEIIGRPMPERAEDITPEENLLYKREIMARQFYRIHDTVKKISPSTKMCFNVPYWKPDEAIWAGHPMRELSDGLVAESANEELVDFLLRIKRDDQRLFLTVINCLDHFRFDPSKWEGLLERGCDIQGYAWGTPPDWRPAPRFKDAIDAFRAFSTAR